MKLKVIDGYYVEATWADPYGFRRYLDKKFLKQDAQELEELINQLRNVHASVVEECHSECSYCGENLSESSNWMYRKKRHEKVPWCCEMALREWCDASFKPMFGEWLNCMYGGHFMMLN
jgi:hypothetical protein